MITLTKSFYTKKEAALIALKNYNTVQTFAIRKGLLKAINGKLLIPAENMLIIIKMYRPFDDAIISIPTAQNKPNEIY
jgi:hypothetical protein